MIEPLASFSLNVARHVSIEGRFSRQSKARYLCWLSMPLRPVSATATGVVNAALADDEPLNEERKVGADAPRVGFGKLPVTSSSV